MKLENAIVSVHGQQQPYSKANWYGNGPRPTQNLKLDN
jgi:hypothetical protein